MRRLGVIVFGWALICTTILLAQPVSQGQVTGLPVPRFVSMKSGSANVRRGPSLNNRIDWVLRHRGTPLRVLAEYQEWFRVEDVDGESGWVHTKLLSPRRTILVQQDLLPLRETPSTAAPMIAKLEAGVILQLGRCQPDWCEGSIGGYTGWVPKSGIFGVSPAEILN